MGAGACKADAVAFDLVDEQEIAANMAFTVIRPVSLQGVTLPFWSERCIVGDQQQHRLLQSAQIVTPGM